MTTYIVANMAADVIKVGRTSISITARLAALQNGNHQLLRVLCLVSSPHSDRVSERMIHEFYADRRIEGIGAREWFAVPADLESIQMDLRMLDMDIEEWVRPERRRRSWLPTRRVLETEAEYLRTRLVDDESLFF